MNESNEYILPSSHHSQTFLCHCNNPFHECHVQTEHFCSRKIIDAVFFLRKQKLFMRSTRKIINDYPTGQTKRFLIRHWDNRCRCKVCRKWHVSTHKQCCAVVLYINKNSLWKFQVRKRPSTLNPNSRRVKRRVKIDQASGSVAVDSTETRLFS